MLEKGTKAPEFTLLDKDGKEVSLADFVGKNIPTAKTERIKVCIPPYEDEAMVKIIHTEK